MTAFLFTWHDHSCTQDAEMLVAAATLGKLVYDSMEFYKLLEREISMLDCVTKARENFWKWWASHNSLEQYPQQSYQQEFNLNSEQPGLIHHHVVFSCLDRDGQLHGETKRRLFAKSKDEEWCYLGVPPDVSPCAARGKAVTKAVHHLHAYAQVGQENFEDTIRTE